jgi:dienelactone hydrolase
VTRLTALFSASSNRRRNSLLLGGLLGLLIVVLLIASIEQDPTAHFDQRRGTLARVESQPLETVAGYKASVVELTSSSGLNLTLSIKRPLGREGLNDQGRRPLLVLLGGHRTGRDAVELIPETRGVIVAALSYPYKGNHRAKGIELVRALPALRRALVDTVPAIQLALDHLLADPEVDPARVELVGVSFGSIFVCIAGARDERARRVWSIHGGGDNRLLLEHNLRREIANDIPRQLVARIAHHLDYGDALSAERWVAGIAPRPFIMVNARDDTFIPAASVERLHAAAADPTELIWVSGRHVTRYNAVVIKSLVDLVLDRVWSDPPPLAGNTAATDEDQQ